jgi:hypothetical protein
MKSASCCLRGRPSLTPIFLLAPFCGQCAQVRGYLISQSDKLCPRILETQDDFVQLKTSQILTVLLRFVHLMSSVHVLTPILLQRRTGTTSAVATPTPPRLLIFMRTRNFSAQARCSSTVYRGHFTETRSSSGRLGDSRYRGRVRSTTIGVGIRI